jgi:hypothetical protein
MSPGARWAGRAGADGVGGGRTVAAGQVTDIWVVSDDLGTLMQLGAVALT